MKDETPTPLVKSETLRGCLGRSKRNHGIR